MAHKMDSFWDQEMQMASALPKEIPLFATDCAVKVREEVWAMLFYLADRLDVSRRFKRGRLDAMRGSRGTISSLGSWVFRHTTGNDVPEFRVSSGPEKSL